DVLQGAILSTGLIAMLIAVIWKVGGPVEAVHIIATTGKINLLPSAAGPWYATLETWAIPVFGSLASAEVLSRVIATRSRTVAQRSSFAAGGLYIAIGSIPVVIALLGPGTTNLIIAITIAAIPVYARIVRITTLQVRGSAFVEASLALGQRRPAIIARHILPNVIGPLLVLATIGIGTSIIAGSSLSFLGLGPVSPTPEWGLMLSDGRNLLGSAWWVAVFPGLAITVTVISTTVLGRALQRRFEGTSA
ncbi:MAG TPA: ABC transporter permease subunit, partial [Microbacteriaceae bacterium]|nr:ABC transporter permease subunit [Microbacteriaceae bacterium]